MPRKTWREEQASGKWSRSEVWEACSVLALIPMFIIGGIVGVVALTLGVDVLARWMVSLIEPLMGPPLLAVVGVALILFAAWGVFRAATGHSRPGISRRDMIVAVMVLIGLLVLGLGLLFAAFASPAPDTAGF